MLNNLGCGRGLVVAEHHSESHMQPPTYHQGCPTIDSSRMFRLGRRDENVYEDVRQTRAHTSGTAGLHGRLALAAAWPQDCVSMTRRELGRKDLRRDLARDRLDKSYVFLCRTWCRMVRGRRVAMTWPSPFPSSARVRALVRQVVREDLPASLRGDLAW